MCGKTMEDCLNCPYEDCIYPEDHIFPWEMEIAKGLEHEAHMIKTGNNFCTDEKREYAKRRYWKNPEERRAYNREYYAKHRERIKQQKIDWAKRNPEKVREMYKRYDAKRRKKIRIA